MELNRLEADSPLVKTHMTYVKQQSNCQKIQKPRKNSKRSPEEFSPKKQCRFFKDEGH